ncbi:hypothetical protein [Lacrimispora sp.]
MRKSSKERREEQAQVHRITMAEAAKASDLLSDNAALCKYKFMP